MNASPEVNASPVVSLSPYSRPSLTWSIFKCLYCFSIGIAMISSCSDADCNYDGLRTRHLHHSSAYLLLIIIFSITPFTLQLFLCYAFPEFDPQDITLETIRSRSMKMSHIPTVLHPSFCISSFCDFLCLLFIGITILG